MAKTTLINALLENNQIIPAGNLKVGDTVQTGWGLREVVKIYTEIIEDSDDMPYGC